MDDVGFGSGVFDFRDGDRLGMGPGGHSAANGGGIRGCD